MSQKMSKVNIVLDMSQYDTFRLCEARYNYRYNLNISLPNKASQLDRGTLVHLAAELYYDGLKNGSSYKDASVTALSKIREAGVTTTELDPEDIARVVDVMEEYFDYWQVADQNLRIKAVEQPFIYVLHEDDEVRIHLAGKIDLIYDDDKYTNLPLDHKSYDRDFEILRMNNQFRNYCCAVGSNYLVVNRIGFQKTLKPHEKFKRVPLSYDDIYLQQWKDNVIRSIMHYLQCAAENQWPMNETSCDKYHRKCEYYQICDSSGIEAKNWKINSNYITVDPWDVSKVLRKASEVLGESNNVKASEG